MRVLIVDTETGGFKKPLAPIEVAGMYVNSAVVRHTPKATGEFLEYFKPLQPMEYGAVAVHNILPYQLQDSPPWNAGLWEKKRLLGVTHMVAHNVDFDAEVLGVPDTVKRIDSLALARYWVPDLDSHKLGAMMYYLFGMTEETKQQLQDAHSALADVRNLARIVVALVDKFAPQVQNWDELYQASELGRIPYRFSFGKYGPKDGKQGMRIRDFMSEVRVNAEFRSYLGWMRREFAKDKYLMAALDKPR